MMPPAPDDGFRSYVAYAIPVGATGLGPAVDLGGYRLAGVSLPSGWITAAITFQGEDPLTGVFAEIQDDAAAAVSVSSTVASRVVMFVNIAAALLPIRVIKIRSGTSGAGVNQTGAPTITLLLDPMG